MREVEVEKGSEAVGLGLGGPGGGPGLASWAAVGLAEGALRLLDVRAGGWAAEMKLAGLPIRSLLARYRVFLCELFDQWSWARNSFRDDVVCLGHPSGQLSLMDLRTGRVLTTRKVP